MLFRRTTTALTGHRLSVSTDSTGTFLHHYCYKGVVFSVASDLFQDVCQHATQIQMLGEMGASWHIRQSCHHLTPSPSSEAGTGSNCPGKGTQEIQLSSKLPPTVSLQGSHVWATWYHHRICLKVERVQLAAGIRKKGTATDRGHTSVFLSRPALETYPSARWRSLPTGHYTI